MQASRRLVRDGATRDDVNEAKERLGAVLAAFPGIVAEESALEEGTRGFTVGLVFRPDNLGRMAALAVDSVSGRVGASAQAVSDTPQAVRVVCSATQFVRLRQLLHYASELQVGERPIAALSQTPLPSLLGRALGAFTRAYDRVRGKDGTIPSLGAWATVLRVVDAQGTDQDRIVRRAAISRRAANVIVGRLERLGRLSVETRSIEGVRRRTRIVGLTKGGEAGRSAAALLAADIEESWRQRFGNGVIDPLREALSSVVDRLPFELPHYVTGYGAGDPSVTGGDYIPEDPGPPRIPAHGQDWPVVLREPGSTSRDLPLPALLSEALAAFAIDYQRERLGSLQVVSNFLRFVPDDGIALEEARTLGGVSGNGKTLHERHLDVVVEPGRAGDRHRRVYLTAKGRRMRDAYPHLVGEIENRWRKEHRDAVSTIRRMLTSMDGDFDADIPAYPDTTGWIHRPWSG